MRKIVCCALGAAVLFSSLGLASCGKKTGGGTRYTIRAEYFPETRTLSADMTATVVNTSAKPLSELKFELWANAYREGAKFKPVSDLFYRSAYYNGTSYGDTEIKGIRGAESFSVGGEDDNILTLCLASALEPGESAEIGISFDVELAVVNHRLGEARSTVNLANFYPVLCHLTDDGFSEYVYSYNGDPFVSAVSDYDVTLTVPAAYSLATGFAAEETELEEKRTYHVCAEGVRDIAFVLGKTLQCVTEEVGGTEVAYYYYRDPSPAETLRCAAESLAFYEDSFGEYAYPRYAVVETGFVYGGMEFPALSMISSDLRENERPSVVAHETAHQWWYAMVGSNQFENAWQDEGLAEYSSALFFEAHPGYGVEYADFIGASESSYRAFFSVYSQLHGEADTTMNRPLTAFSGEYEYRNIAYDKGVILFDRIREVTGERKFMNALKRYAGAYQGKIASPAQLVGCFSKAGANVSALFDSFLEGKCVI